MSFSTILAPVDHSAGARVSLEVATKLAKRFDARLLILAHAPPVPHVPLFDMPLAVDDSVYETNSKAAEEAALRAKEAAQSAGVTASLAHLRWPMIPVQEAVARCALFADLIVAPRIEASGPSSRAVVEGALFASPAPLLVWPPELDPAAAETLTRTPTIAWDARPQASRAARYALDLLRSAESVAAVVIDQGYGGAAYEHNPGEDFTTWLEREGVAAELRVLQASSVADALLGDVAERGSDLLVMGAYGHSQTFESIFGGVTETLLRTAPLPLFMAH